MPIRGLTDHVWNVVQLIALESKEKAAVAA